MYRISETSSCVLCKYDVEVADISVYQLRHALISGKDKLQKDFPDVAYKNPSADWESIYIGEMGHIKQLLWQHQNDADKKQVVSNGLAVHKAMTEHTSTLTEVSDKATVICGYLQL